MHIRLRDKSQDILAALLLTTCIFSTNALAGDIYLHCIARTDDSPLPKDIGGVIDEIYKISGEGSNVLIYDPIRYRWKDVYSGAPCGYRMDSKSALNYGATSCSSTPVAFDWSYKYYDQLGTRYAYSSHINRQDGSFESVYVNDGNKGVQVNARWTGQCSATTEPAAPKTKF